MKRSIRLTAFPFALLAAFAATAAAQTPITPFRRQRRALILCGSIALLLAALPQSPAATLTWNGTGANGNWSTSGNLSGVTSFTSADDLVFTGNNYLTTNSHDAASGTAVNSITFNAGAGAFTLNGSALALSGGITNASSSVQTVNLGGLTLNADQTIDTGAGMVIHSPIVLQGASGQRTLLIKGTGPATVDGGISEAGGATGAVIISGFAEEDPEYYGLFLPILTFDHALKLAGTSTYSGGTTIGTDAFTAVEFTSLGNFGTGSLTLQLAALRWAAGNTADISSRFATGTAEIVDPASIPAALAGSDSYVYKTVTAPQVRFGAFDTNGNNVTFGTAFFTSFPSGFEKLGAGTLSLNSRSYLGGAIGVIGGTLEFAGPGSGTALFDYGYLNSLLIGGDGQTLIRDGAQMVVGEAIIDSHTGATATMTVSNASTKFLQDVTVGETGKGSLAVRQGGAVTVLRNAVVGGDSGSQGALTVTNSSFSAGTALVVGGAGTGTAVFDHAQISTGTNEAPAIPGFDPNNPTAESIYLYLYGVNNLVAPNMFSIGGNPGAGASGAFGSPAGLASAFNSVFATLGQAARQGGVGTVTVQNSSVMNVFSQINVGYSGTGTLNILSDSSVFTSDAFIGGDNDKNISVSYGDGTFTLTAARGASGTGFATVDDALWAVGGALTVGARGSGTLTVKNSGELYAVDAYIGSQTDGAGTVIVTDSMSTLGLSGSLNVGGSQTGPVYFNINLADIATFDPDNFITFPNPTSAGVGNLSILNAGNVSVQGDSNIGNWRAQGTVTVNGGYFNTTGALNIGQYGTGTLNIGTDGSVVSGTANIGNFAGSDGTVTLIGNGYWNVNDTLKVGNAGTGTLSLGAGTALTASGNTSIGTLAGGNGTANVSGGYWVNEQALIVGDAGSGLLNLTNGGRVNSLTGTVGNASTGIGNVTLDDSSWRVTDQLTIGASGQATVALKSGGLSSASGVVGSGAGSSATLTVDGLGANWTMTGNLAIGDAGTGTVTISNGGAITAGGYTEISRTSAGRGTLNVNGGTWTNTGNLSVGTRGLGSLVTTAGTVKADSFYIGDQSGGQGQVSLTGGSMQAKSNFILGNLGAGNLLISGASTLTVGGYSALGLQGDSSGAVTMQGGTWTNTGNLSVGTNSTGAIDQSGGNISAANVYVGDQSSGTGRFDITGTGRLNATNLSVGYSGNGLMTISGYAKAGATYIAQNAGSQGALTLAGTPGFAGFLETGQINKGAGTGSLTFDGGGVRLSHSSASFLSGFSAGDVQILPGRAYFDTNGFSTTIQTPLQGVGGFSKIGAGSLTLTGSHGYTGSTNVVAGTLTIADNAAFNSAVTVSTGATLSLDIASDVRLLQGVSGAGAVNVMGTAATARLAGNDSGFTGTFTLASTARGMMWSSADAGSASAKWQLDGSFAAIETGAGNTTIQLGELSGSNSTAQLGAFGGSGVKTFEIGALGTNSTFAGSIRTSTSAGSAGSSTVAVRKVGAGTLTLSGANTYTAGTFVNQGTLLIQGSLSGNTLVSSQGTLGGTGTVGNTTVSGALAPGNNGVGLLTVAGYLTLDSSAVTTFEIGGTSTSLFDRISVRDTLWYAGMLNISFLDDYLPQAGDSFQLFSGFSLELGSFAQINFSDPGVVGQMNYSTGQLNIISVPEPSTWLLLACALALLAALRVRSPKRSAASKPPVRHRRVQPSAQPPI